ncbi:alpha-galactosidase [Actinoallomurus purpureus]|uniref:glycoside hydrolase family 36 protein n=1 Tax=Actinoallomurus purpureus TaxID=478114 RepID=UPI002092626E|nr:glycoside hydrolase family 36 protein [Actinoallomurus purpureus]MCO6011303.1 alpha-galactosidase [Actinoallomurus purpureus]
MARPKVDPDKGRVYEHGWQSWSPTTTYPVTGTSHRPVQPVMQTMCWRPDRPGPERGFQGEGLLAVDPGDGGPIRVYAALDGRTEVPSIRATYAAGALVIDPDGEIEETVFDGPLETALAAWADGFAALTGARPPRLPPTAWCSWYHYFGAVTEDDVLENLDAVGRHDLPVDVIQIDDGWQAEIGDWLAYSGRFASLERLADRIRQAGRRAGIWVAPFLIGARSALSRVHPDWLTGDAGHNWDQDLRGLDIARAEDHLREIFGALRSYGFDYFKLDFLYAGALGGLDAYRHGLSVIREAVGPDAYLLGCGAPILPSVGLLDAMRVSPDVDPGYEPAGGDMSRPSQHAAATTTVGRAWQHGRFWVNDPDCLIARPAVERREEWARVVERYGGLRASSDRIADLDDWGLSTTRRLLSDVPDPATPFIR